MSAVGRRAEKPGREGEHLAGLGDVEFAPAEHIAVEVRRDIEIAHVKHQVPKFLDLPAALHSFCS